MQTTQQLLNQLKGAKLVTCSSCERQVPLGEFVERQREDDLIEIGFSCVNCGEWYHSFFLDNHLKETRPDTKSDRKTRRAYKKEFDKFQKVTRKKLGMKKENGRWLNGTPAS